MLALTIAGCSLEKLTTYQLVAPEKSPVLTAKGYAPIKSQPGPSSDQKFVQAMEASRMDAYRRLAEQLYGQQLRSYTRLEGETVGRKSMEVKVQGVVRGAKVTHQRVEGEFYTTEVSLDTATLATLGSVESKPLESEHKWWF
ncbi:LPP20 family lipoprotein [Shewanella mangrovi]|uniref:LPP20 family lipoprotein n=1 Tax=Shewanella mangrovi TaxID=1515746 RepID=UPI00138DD4DA|nr:LPP20 family lipoprotein [Shewanella mangrovi]